MFNSAKLREAMECQACNGDIDDEDSASFVSIGDERFRNHVNKPLVIFFLYSGVTTIEINCNIDINYCLPQDNPISDKVCLECFDKFKGISDFYNRCKNSRSKYTPCFRDSGSEDVISTPRILSTETPDITSSESRGRPSSDLISSIPGYSRSVPTQTLSSCNETQSAGPPVKKSYVIHHDLGIRLPKPISNNKGCFDSEDFCYLMLQDEFDRENALVAEKERESKRTMATCDIIKKFPPISAHHERQAMSGQAPHTHIANCPFCPALIQRKHPRF